MKIHNRKFKYTYIEHPGAVFVTAFNKKQELVCIRIFRFPLDEWCIEVPSGGIGDKSKVTLLKAAKEELEEEAGYAGGRWTSLGWRWSAQCPCDFALSGLFETKKPNSPQVLKNWA